jgi:hypothetical protein
MKKYINNIEINGQRFTHTVEAFDYKEALVINKKRNTVASLRGRRIYGRLVKAD